MLWLMLSIDPQDDETEISDRSENLHYDSYESSDTSDGSDQEDTPSSVEEPPPDRPRLIAVPSSVDRKEETGWDEWPESSNTKLKNTKLKKKKGGKSAELFEEA